MKRIIGIAISLITMLFVSAVFCACGNSDSKNDPPQQSKYYTVSFIVHPVIGGGYIEGKAEQRVKEGESTEKITAVAEYGYYFAGWSDEGADLTDETATRVDKVINNVTQNINYVAIFEKITLTVSYASDKNGYIDGVSEQSVKYGEASDSVTAVPYTGYRFKEWSDGVKTATRNEQELKEHKTLTASFELITNIYTYDYKYADGNCDDKDVALTYSRLDSAKLAVPTREHAIFAGWYADKLLTTQVSDKDGNIITDDGLLYTDCDTLYAKWIGENTHQYKILVVYVTELNADIMKSDGSGKKKVQYKMSETERKICHMLTQRLEFWLNDLAVADFVVDEYFTTDPLDDKSIEVDKYYSTGRCCSEVMPYGISEASGLYSEYDSVLSSFSFGDYDGELTNDGGSGIAKYGCIHFDGSLSHALYNNTNGDKTEIKTDMEKFFDPSFDRWDDLISTYLHELAHTIELRVTGLFEFHKVLSAYEWEMWKNTNIAEQLYFLNKAIVDGETAGIPFEFWQGKVAIVFYEAEEGGYINSIPHHNIIVEECNAKDDRQYVIYNSDALSVKAYAFTGYEFVSWSDGVTTEIRQDKNIIADMHIYAIFKKIEDTK